MGGGGGVWRLATVADDSTTNALHYGDNLDVLRYSIANGGVDLVYLDPPFNSQANYNVLFRSTAGGGSYTGSREC